MLNIVSNTEERLCLDTSHLIVIANNHIDKINLSNCSDCSLNLCSCQCNYWMLQQNSPSSTEQSNHNVAQHNMYLPGQILSNNNCQTYHLLMDTASWSGFCSICAISVPRQGSRWLASLQTSKSSDCVMTFLLLLCINCWKIFPSLQNEFQQKQLSAVSLKPPLLVKYFEIVQLRKAVDINC